MQNNLLQDSRIASVKNHFFYYFKLFASLKLVPYACFEETSKAVKSVVGIPFPYYNFIYDDTTQGDWEKKIQQELSYFKKHHLPFTWFVDENEQPELRNTLLKNRFIDSGVLQGLIGSIEMQEASALPKEYEIVKVRSKQDSDALCETMCKIFQMDKVITEMVTEGMWQVTNDPACKVQSWVVKRRGKVISTITTAIQNDIVSFWNGSTIPEYRNQGLCTALEKIAANEAVQAGCKNAVVYTMSDGMALGICYKMGLSSVWKFNGFIAPN